MKRRIQCGSCEQVSLKDEKKDDCPKCGSGNWVYGYIDLPAPKWVQKEIKKGIQACFCGDFNCGIHQT